MVEEKKLDGAVHDNSEQESESSMNEKKKGKKKKSEEHSQRKKLLNYIFEYRDIVLLVLLVISGFTWMYSVFATQAQLKALSCITEQSAFMELTKFKRDIRMEALLTSRGKLSVLLDRKKNGMKVSDIEIDGLTDSIKTLEEDIKKIDGERDDALNKIKKQECK